MKIFRSVLLVILFSSFATGAIAIEKVTKYEKPEDVVIILYHDFGWEAQYPEKYKDKVLLIDQPFKVLEQYFSQKLASLIYNDRKQEIKTHELGRIDFVLLFGSQDPDGINNIRIKQKSDKVVSVLYDQNGEKDVMVLIYEIINTKNGYRIGNINYKTRNSNAFSDPGLNFSLLKLLTE